MNVAEYLKLDAIKATARERARTEVYSGMSDLSRVDPLTAREIESNYYAQYSARYEELVLELSK